jgi:hypothetical protein
MQLHFAISQGPCILFYDTIVLFASAFFPTQNKTHKYHWAQCVCASVHGQCKLACSHICVCACMRVWMCVCVCVRVAGRVAWPSAFCGPRAWKPLQREPSTDRLLMWRLPLRRTAQAEDGSETWKFLSLHERIYKQGSRRWMGINVRRPASTFTSKSSWMGFSECDFTVCVGAKKRKKTNMGWAVTEY